MFTSRLTRVVGVSVLLFFMTLGISHASTMNVHDVSEVAQQRIIRGTVRDYTGEPLPGAMVMVVGTTRGAMTDIDGAFSIEVGSGYSLSFSLLGMEEQIVEVTNQTEINVTLYYQADLLDEFVMVAFGRQRRESVIAAASTVNPRDLQVPSSNLTTAFAGRVAGLISYQRSGEPGQDNAQFFIRGITTFGTGRVGPLILIDGVEATADDLARLTPDDIESFSVMRDANATALYGARGANGVILVATREGRQGPLRVSFRAEGSFSSPTEMVQMADPVTFMRMHNEAVRTRTPGIRLPYSESHVFNTARGHDPLRYPALDWRDMLFDTRTFNHRYTLNLSGGGAIARYFVSASYAADNGILRVDPRQNFNNNISIRRYSLRSNINLDLTPTTEAIVRLSGTFDDMEGPIEGGTMLFRMAALANPVRFHPYYRPDAANIHARHILFGNAPGGGYLNPYAEMLRGFRTNDRSTMSLAFEVRQDLDFILEGLSARALYHVNRFSRLEVRRAFNPFFYSLAPRNPLDPGEYRLIAINPDTGTDWLDYAHGPREMRNTMYFEGAVNYRTTIASLHDVSGLLVFHAREEKETTQTANLLISLPRRNMGLAGRFTYGFDNRYLLEANFGFNGSERFYRTHRWGFFPSIGAAWNISNEEFMDPIANTVSLLRLKVTHGLVGNDEIGQREHRFFYMSNVNMMDGGRGMWFGDTWGHYRPGVSISRYGNPNITWEVAHMSNFGVEIGLWDALELHVDYFRQRRTHILQRRADIPTTMGLQAPLYANIGEAFGSGIDAMLSYQRFFTRDMWLRVQGTFTFNSSRFVTYEEPDFSATPWRSREGQRISQRWGLIAERLFLDDEEVRNAPRQMFGMYGAGDIKFKDINGDGIIDENDFVPIGWPTTPEINYGFGFTFGFRNFDINAFFQGSARSSFWINPTHISPFVDHIRDQSDLSSAVGGRNINRAVLQVIADSHWTEANRDIHAFWPRLSADYVQNNLEVSTWFMRNGSFLRLKNVEVGYELPTSLLQNSPLSRVRFYASGTNLAFIARSFRTWDPELAGNPFNYPLQRVINFGVNLDF